MATESARPSLHDVGHRRPILALGVCWGATPALTFLVPESPTRALLAVGALATVSLAVLCELDSRALERHGTGVPLAWSYALVAPISAVAWTFLGPALVGLPPLSLLGILVGPPASALLYVWQRGRRATVR